MEVWQVRHHLPGLLSRGVGLGLGQRWVCWAWEGRVEGGEGGEKTHPPLSCLRTTFLWPWRASSR